MTAKINSLGKEKNNKKNHRNKCKRESLAYKKKKGKSNSSF